MKRFLSSTSNQAVTVAFESIFAPTPAKSKQADTCRVVVQVQGLKECVAHHSSSKGGTRTLAAEALVKNIAVGAVFSIEKENVPVSDTAIKKLLGLSPNQIKQAGTKARDMHTSGCIIKPIARVRRKDCVLHRVERYIFEFCQNEEVTRLDTNQGLVTVTHPHTGEEVQLPHRIWLETNKRRQWSQFIQSDEYKDFQDAYPGLTVGYTIFARVVRKCCRFVSNPKPQSCVGDNMISGVEHMMEALYRVVKRPNVREELEQIGLEDGDATYDELVQVLRQNKASGLVHLLCCPKREEPSVP